MDISIFEIPLLRDEIAQHLLPNHLARCCLVSKEWNTWFTSLLWRDIILTSESNTQVLDQYQNHMRSIISLGGKIYHRLLCPNLRSLDCSAFTYAMLETASQSPLLQDLIIRNFNVVNGEGLGYLFKALKCLPLLRNLCLHFACRINTGTVQRIIEASRHCESLYLLWEPYSRGYHFGNPEQGYEVESVKSAMDQMDGIQFRNLAIGLPSEEQGSIILIPLLEKCHLLECLNLIHTYATGTMQKISDILRSNPHRRLRSLNIGGATRYAGSQYMHDEDISNLFSAIGGQENENGKPSKTNEEGGIQTLAIGDDLYLDRLVIQALYRYLSNSLIDLNLRSRLMSPENLASLTSHLPNLKSFKVSIPFIVDQKESELKHVFSSPWACLKIQKLNLSIISHNRNRKRQDNWRDLTNRYFEYIFSQIGECTELEEWELGSTSHFLTQHKGYLEYLTGLKQLKSLRLQSYTCCKKFTYKDLKWMLEHWPRLIYFRVSNEHPWYQRRRVQSAYDINPKIKYLKTARPWLEII